MSDHSHNKGNTARAHAFHSGSVTNEDQTSSGVAPRWDAGGCCTGMKTAGEKKTSENIFLHLKSEKAAGGGKGYPPEAEEMLPF